MLQGTEERRGKGDGRAAEAPRAQTTAAPQTMAARAWALELSPGKRRSVQKDPRRSQAQGWGGGRPTETSSPLPTCPQLGHKSSRSWCLPSSHLLYPISHSFVSCLTRHLEDTGMAAKHHQAFGFLGSFSTNQSLWNRQRWNAVDHSSDCPHELYSWSSTLLVSVPRSIRFTNKVPLSPPSDPRQVVNAPKKSQGDREVKRLCQSYTVGQRSWGWGLAPSESLSRSPTSPLWSALRIFTMVQRSCQSILSQRGCRLLWCCFCLISPSGFAFLSTVHFAPFPTPHPERPSQTLHSSKSSLPIGAPFLCPLDSPILFFLNWVKCF